jgi:dTDP-glucose pyrophosphorylase/mevalonate kinase
MDEKEFEIFVPGRLCLVGEHSDWAGGHRRQNPEIEKGYAIIAQTNQGNYAKVKSIHEQVLRVKSPLSREIFEVELNSKVLLEIAEGGGLFSYIAGVAYEMISSYYTCTKHGIEIDNYKTDLLIKKGLSSSASICVLIAKAFDKVYNLNLTDRRIMELAYLGENNTPSRCGRMDQACAYDKPIMMTFDGDKVQVEELNLKKELNFLIVDLKKGKDTKKILKDLNQGFPWPNTSIERGKHQYLGGINKGIIKNAKKALEEGNSEKLGILMNLAQDFFDEYLKPSSPEELSAPILHSILSMNELIPFIYGGKGVGSGGDGALQLVCKNKESRDNAKRILIEKGFGCFDLDLIPKKENKTLKALIVAGGFGERLYPFTQNCPKSLLKIKGKPLLDYVIEKINEIKEVNQIIIVTNNKFYEQFVKWKENKKENIILLNNGINSTQEPSSGLGNLLIGIDDGEIDEDLFVIGGDNLFECSLKEIYEIFKKEGKDIALFYDVKDFERAKSLGVGKIKDNLLIDFKEKPEYPETTICSTSAYFYKRETLKKIEEFAQMQPHGNLGKVLEYLHRTSPVYAYVVKEKWVDINDRDSLKLADPSTYDLI